MKQDYQLLLKFILDFICLAIAGIPVLVFFVAGKPFRRGFFCDDDSIMYPYKPSTVTNNVLYIVGILLPVASMVVIETLRTRIVPSVEQSQQLKFFGLKIPFLAWQFYKKIGVFLFGACISQTTTDIGKYSIGRLRPHFYQVCDPRNTCLNTQNVHEYVTDYQCSSNSPLVREARLSFPSGHASFSFYTMVYLVLYLQARLTFTRNKLLRPLLQAILLYMAWFTALSRVSDYKHHWSDVLFGGLQGSLVAVLVIFYVSDLFAKHHDTRTPAVTEVPNERVPFVRTSDVPEEPVTSNGLMYE